MTTAEVRELAKRFFGLARFMGVREQDAEDIAAEVIMRMHTGRIQTLPGAYVAVKNLCVDSMRLTENRHKDSLDYDQEMGGMNAPAVLTDFTEIEVEDFLSKLPPTYAEVLRVQMTEDLPDPEQAAALGISPSAYKTRLYRARSEARYRVGLAQWVEA